jgi:hypothetical protein
MKSIRLNIRALAFDGNTSLPSSRRINYNSEADAHELAGSGGSPLGKLGVLRMTDLIALEVISATDHAYVSRVAHSGQAGVTNFAVRSCHVGFKRQISTSPTRETNPSTGASQVGPFALGPTDELVLTSNGNGEQSVTLALMVGTAIEVERLIDRSPPLETENEGSGELHASSHHSGGLDPIKLDDLAAPDDNTDLNASATRHGLLRKLSDNLLEYLDGTGAWASLPTAIEATKLDDLATPDDNTDLNASTTRHGLLRKLSNVATEYLDGTGAWSSLTTAITGTKLDDLATPDDNTDLNASTTRHGLLRKLSNVATEYLDGTGGWSSLTTAITSTKLDDLAAPDDNTDLNASATRHGLLRKLSNVASQYLSGAGTWTMPSGTMHPILCLASTAYLQTNLTPATLSESSGAKPYLNFITGVDRHATFFVQLPDTYLGGDLTLTLWWTGSTNSTNAMAWRTIIEVITAGQSTTISNGTTAALGTTAAPATGGIIQASTYVRTNANLDGASPGDWLRIVLQRQGTASADSHAGTGLVLGFQLTQ